MDGPFLPHPCPPSSMNGGMGPWQQLNNRRQKMKEEEEEEEEIWHSPTKMLGHGKQTLTPWDCFNCEQSLANGNMPAGDTLLHPDKDESYNTDTIKQQRAVVSFSFLYLPAMAPAWSRLKFTASFLNCWYKSKHSIFWFKLCIRIPSMEVQSSKIMKVLEDLLNEIRPLLSFL